MKKLYIIIVLMLVFFVPKDLSAQCSMCTANAEMGSKNGNTQTVGLNSGVLYLLSIPFLMAGSIGLLWYTKFRAHKA